jgi:hypothetical protein
VLVLERVDFTVALPTLYVVIVNQSLGEILRPVVVGADKFYGTQDASLGPLMYARCSATLPNIEHSV